MAQASLHHGSWRPNGLPLLFFCCWETDQSQNHEMPLQCGPQVVLGSWVLPVQLQICKYLSIYLSICLSIYLYIHYAKYCTTFHHMDIWMYGFTYTYVCVYIYIYVKVCLHSYVYIYFQLKANIICWNYLPVYLSWGALCRTVTWQQWWTPRSRKCQWCMRRKCVHCANPGGPAGYTIKVNPWWPWCRCILVYCRSIILW